MAQGNKTGGRQKGTPNKITTVFKDAVRIVYEDIGGHAAFADWARRNQTEFYRIAARLIPSEMHMNEDNRIVVVLREPFDDHQDAIPSPSVPALPATVEH